MFQLSLLFAACSNELSLLSALPDSQLTSSSSFDEYSTPANSRLHQVASGSYGGWFASINQAGEWIQADLDSTAHVYKIATQARNSATVQDQWLTSYQLATSISGLENEFDFVTSSPGGDPRDFHANSDSDTVVTRAFLPRVARFVRLYPQTWHVYISLRWEVYGCYSGKTSNFMQIPSV